MKIYNKHPEAVSLLTPEQYRVTQQDGTERSFKNECWDNKEPGLKGDRCNGRGCGNGRDEADGAARAAGSDKRRRCSGSCLGIHLG
jgi:peptide-methionine (R)-S-oxide reductase